MSNNVYFNKIMVYLFDLYFYSGFVLLIFINDFVLFNGFVLFNYFDLFIFK